MCAVRMHETPDDFVASSAKNLRKVRANRFVRRENATCNANFFGCLLPAVFCVDAICGACISVLRVDVACALKSASLLTIRNVLRFMHVALKAVLEQDS